MSLIEEASLGRVKYRTLFRRRIRRVLTKIRECWDDGADYCPKNNTSSGRPPKIEVNSAVANMIADLHEKNHLSVAMITHLLNINKIVNPNKTVYRDCQVYSCINRMKPLRRAFHKRKQGDLSVNSAWAKARFNLCAHLGVRMGLYKDDASYKSMVEVHFGKKLKAGEKIWKDESKLVPIYDWLNREMCAKFAIDVERVAWYDEKHVKQQIGGLGKRDTYVVYPRNEKKVVDLEHGVYPDVKKCVVNTKFSDQFCGLFGVAVKDGVGEPLPSWYYSDCNLNTVKTYNGHLNKVWKDYVSTSDKFDVVNDIGFDWKERVKDKSADKDHSQDTIDAYKAWYGSLWLENLQGGREMQRNRSVTHMVDHTFDCAKALYEKEGDERKW